jgi:hypothetical protein
MAWLKSFLAVGTASALCVSADAANEGWVDVEAAALNQLADDDLAQHASEPDFLLGLKVSQIRFSESGFDWQIIRFTNVEHPVGPLWAVPHDDENAAFESAIAAVKQHGGVALMVNSGPGSSRMQVGEGTCGGRPAIVSRCDPNRNFSDATPLFTRTFLDQLPAGQPVVALHTNSPGFGKGRGEITMVDAGSAATGATRVRFGGHFGKAAKPPLDNYDTYAIIPYAPPKPSAADEHCRASMVESGVHVWHERVDRSDGSFSNYVAQKLPDVRYVNMESRRESDLNLAAERHRLMIEAYLNGCPVSGN